MLRPYQYSSLEPPPPPRFNIGVYRLGGQCGGAGFLHIDLLPPGPQFSNIKPGGWRGAERGAPHNHLDTWTVAAQDFFHQQYWEGLLHCDLEFLEHSCLSAFLPASLCLCLHQSARLAREALRPVFLALGSWSPRSCDVRSRAANGPGYALQGPRVQGPRVLDGGAHCLFSH